MYINLVGYIGSSERVRVRVRVRVRARVRVRVRVTCHLKGFGILNLKGLGLGEG